MTNRRDPRSTDGSVSVVEHVDAGFITLTQAAQYLAVSSRTVRRWVEDRHLPHYYIGGPERGRLLFRKGELDRWTRQFKNGLSGGPTQKSLDGMGPAGL
jgi:excisionase family DNA binding protein